MCRSIKTLRPPFENHVTEQDIQAAALQYVRKISGFRQPSRANSRAFDTAVKRIAMESQRLLDSLVVDKRSARVRSQSGQS